MKIVGRFVFVIGVTLCVTPFFTSALAQQSGNSEARLYLDVQAMRAEIAELRDMVERQQYQLRLMERKLEAASAATTPSLHSAPAPATGSTIGAVPSAGSTSVAPAAPETSPMANVEPQQASAEPAAAEATRPAVDDGFYRPYDEQQPGPGDAANEEVSALETAGVEERVITAPPLSRAETGTGYPPVEDRSIGAPRTATVDTTRQSAPVTQYPAQSAQPVQGAVAPATTAPGDLQQPPAIVSGQPEQASGTAPVIAIPAPSAQTGSDTAQAPGQVATGTVQAADQAVSQPPAVQQSVPSQAPQQTVPQAVVLSEQEYYTQGFNLVKQSKFRDAIAVFKQLIAQHPQGSLAGDAYYWIGESSFLARDLNVSKQYFKAFIENYPQSGRVPGAMLRTAYIEQEQGNEIEARILLNEIIQYYPSSDAVHAARNRLAALENQIN